MKVLKFGGSSVANASNINKVIDIVLESQKTSGGIVVVVSALGGVTDNLIKLVNLACQKNLEYKALFGNIRQKHDQLIADLIKSENRKDISAQINKKYSELEKILKEIYTSGKFSKAALDSVVSFGEQLSAYITSEAIKSRDVLCEFVDSRKIIQTDDNFGEANVDIESSYQLISDYFKNKNKLFVMGGFIASTKKGEPTTLGRGGSDYTASLVGATLGVSAIEVWKDVDGMMTADPRKVKNAQIISELSYVEAEKMALAGAKILHPKTMKPARLKNIPIYIRNTFNPQALGTKIWQK